MVLVFTDLMDRSLSSCCT